MTTVHLSSSNCDSNEVKSEFEISINASQWPQFLRVQLRTLTLPWSQLVVKDIHITKPRVFAVGPFA